MQPTQNHQQNDSWANSQCVRLSCPVLAMFTAVQSSPSHQDGLAALPTSSRAAVPNLSEFDVPSFTPNKYQNGPTNKILRESQNAQWKETKVSHNRCKGINILLLTILCPVSSEVQHDMHIQQKVTAQYEWILQYGSALFRSQQAVSWHRRLFTGLSLRRLGFNPRSVHVRFVVDKVALGQGFLRVFRVSPVSIIPQMLHIYLHLRVAVSGRTDGWSPRAFQIGNALSKFEKQWMQKYWNCFVLKGLRKAVSLQSHTATVDLAARTCAVLPFLCKVHNMSPTMCVATIVYHCLQRWKLEIRKDLGISHQCFAYGCVTCTRCNIVKYVAKH